MGSESDSLCYRCEVAATTREHVPPDCFFPVGHRDPLWTVPSCEVHNLGNSKDVEYVRNVLSFARGSNETALGAFSKATRSLDRSPKLFEQTFVNFQELSIDGEPAGAFTVDLPRFKVVMSAIAAGVAYRDFGRRYRGDWRIVCSTLLSRRPSPDWQRLLGHVRSGAYVEKPTPHPSVFAYSISNALPAGFVYRFLFYDAIEVFAWPELQPDA